MADIIQAIYFFQMDETCSEHDKKVFMYCETCDEYVCLLCISSSHKGHMICPPKKARTLPIGDICPIHNRSLLHVCKTCNNDPLCWNCYYPRHVKHETIDFSLFKNLTNGTISRNVDNNKVKGHIDLATAQIKQRRDELKAQVDFMGQRLVEEMVSQSRKNKKRNPNFKNSKVAEKEIAKLFGYLSY